MSAAKNKRLRQQTFIFRKPLTNKPPASAGNRARQRGVCESIARENLMLITHLTAATCAAAAICLGRSEYEKKALSIEETTLYSSKVSQKRTFIFLSDLHENTFGQENEKLIQAIDQIQPDAILNGGDLIVTKGTDAKTSHALSLIKELASRYPVYCGEGNHENRIDWEPEKYGSEGTLYRNALKQAGAICLKNDSAIFDTEIRITGIDLDKDFYKKALIHPVPPMPDHYMEEKAGKADKDHFQILLSHSPLYFDNYVNWGADLTLSGHFHGGTIRLPGLGGVMTPQYQFFLPWCAGIFESQGHYMAVSRGLGTHSINIRLNNRPQLLVLHICPQIPGRSHTIPALKKIL